MYKEESSDIIKDLVESLLFPVSISSVTGPVGNVYTVEACDMYHAQPGFPVTIGGNSYTITDIIPGKKVSCGVNVKDVLKVSGSSPIVATTFNLYTPKFFVSTPIAQGVEMAQKPNQLDKVPMAWLYEQYTENASEDPLSTKEKDIRFRLFFLTRCDHDNWLTEQCRKEAIKPMKRLAQNFIDKIKSKAWRFDVDNFEYTFTNYAKFGVFIANRGMEKKAWHDKLGGVEVSGTLTVLRDDGCEDCES